MTKIHSNCKTQHLLVSVAERLSQPQQISGRWGGPPLTSLHCLTTRGSRFSREWLHLLFLSSFLLHKWPLFKSEIFFFEMRTNLEPIQAACAGPTPGAIQPSLSSRGAGAFRLLLNQERPTPTGAEGMCRRFLRMRQRQVGLQPSTPKQCIFNIFSRPDYSEQKTARCRSLYKVINSY